MTTRDPQVGWVPKGNLPTVSELSKLHPATRIDPVVMSRVRMALLLMRANYNTEPVSTRVPLHCDTPLGRALLLPSYGDPDVEIALRVAVAQAWLKDNSMRYTDEQVAFMMSAVTFEDGK